MPDNPFKFWEELKRRKVVRVVIGYAAAAYVLLELTSIIAGPWGLPEWTINFVSVILIIGFFVTVIISWIFDVTPEGLKKTESSKATKLKGQSEQAKRKLRLSDGIIALLLVTVCILLYPKIFNKDKFEGIRGEDGRISIVVMPFENNTNDSLLKVWETGIPYQLTNNLLNSEGLFVFQFQTMYEILKSREQKNYSSFSSSVASDISRKLEINTFIQGNIIKSGNLIRINAQLLDSKTEEIYQSFQVDGNSVNDMITMTDSLSNSIMDYLKIRKMKEKMIYEARSCFYTNSPKAYQYLMQGFNQGMNDEWLSAVESFNKAASIDTNMFLHNIFLVGANINSGQFENAKKAFDQLSEHVNELSFTENLQYEYWKYYFEKKPLDEIRVTKLSIDQDPKNRAFWFTLGWEYNRIDKYREAIEAFEKVLELNKTLETQWDWIDTYNMLGRCYHKTGNHKREKEIYELAFNIDPENKTILERQVICSLSQGDTIEANRLFERYFSLTGDVPEHRKMNFLGYIYYSADDLEKSTQYYRKALEIKPDYIAAMDNLASNLFEQGKSLNEGMDLINQALETFPERPLYLYTKGKGLYKLGSLKESIELFEKVWDLYPFYYHNLYLDMKEVEQALAKQKSEQ